MNRDKILQEIMSDPELMQKYGLTKSDIEKLRTSPPYSKKVIEIMSVIINENDNHLSSTQIYKRIKNIHNI